MSVNVVRGPTEIRGLHSGKSPETIARRLFGRQAEIRRSPDPNNPHDMIVRTDKYGTHVLAEIIVCAEPTP